jgi:hypothetical protein
MVRTVVPVQKTRGGGKGVFGEEGGRLSGRINVFFLILLQSLKGILAKEVIYEGRFKEEG